MNEKEMAELLKKSNESVERILDMQKEALKKLSQKNDSDKCTRG